MIRNALVVTGLILGMAPPVLAAGVRLERLDHATRLEASLPGRIVAYALPKTGDGRREILLLVDTQPPVAPDAKADPEGASPCGRKESAPALPRHARTLMRLATGGEGSLEVLREDLPAEAEGLDAADLDGDGAEEILLLLPGRIEVLRDSGERRAARGPELLMADPWITREDSSRPEPRLLRQPETGAASLIDVALLGGVRFYGPSSDRLSWDLLCEAALPLIASRDDAGLKLTGSKVRAVGRRPSGAPLFASGPERQGRERLNTILIDPEAPEAERSIEVWSRLPGPERVMESAYLMLDGRPALAAVTRPADKLSIFGEKLLRIFYLDETDRSRTGSAPVFAVDTQMNIWQPGTLLAADVDRDGRQDLVVGYWKGLKDSRVMLDAYLREKDGSFRRSPVNTGFDVEGGNRSMVGFGQDFDGDGAADLMLLAGDRMMIHPGSASSRGGRGLVDVKPRWSVSLPAQDSASGDFDDVEFHLGLDSEGGDTRISMMTPNAPRPIDLDGDGRPEILFAGTAKDGSGVFLVIDIEAR